MNNTKIGTKRSSSIIVKLNINSTITQQQQMKILQIKQKVKLKSQISRFNNPTHNIIFSLLAAKYDTR